MVLCGGGGGQILIARADGAAIEGAFDAEQTWITGDLVAEDTNIVENWLDPRRNVLGIAQSAFELQVERGIVKQSTERTFTAVEVVSKRNKLLEQLVDIRQAAIQIVDQLRPALAQWLCEVG